MKAMLFAAGLGTRLHPLTLDRPKALVELGGKPLLQIHLERLRAAGCKEVVVNVHHFAGRMRAFLHSREWGMHIHISDESELLLETGGGLVKAAPLFGDAENILVINTDILTNLDLAAFMQQHIRGGALATLASRQRQTSRVFLWDQHLRLCGWRNTDKGEERLVRSFTGDLIPLAFSGIHALRMKLIPLITRTGVFSMTDVYLDLAAQGHDIQAFRHDTDFWIDVGKPQHLEEAKQHLHLL